MKYTLSSLALVLLLSHAQADMEGSPLYKVIDLLNDMQQQMVKEGKKADAEYAEYVSYCKSQGGEVVSELKQAQFQARDLTAIDDQQEATIAELTTRTEELAADIAFDDSELKDAKEERKRQAAKFARREPELIEFTAELKKAIAYLEKAGKGASMLQMKNAGSVVQALSAIIQSSIVDTAEASKLTSLIQAAQDEDDEAFGLSAADSKSRYGSRNIIDILEDLMTKADERLDELRKKEKKSIQDMEMLEQSLNQQMKGATRDMADAKKGISAAQEKLSGAQRDLGIIKKAMFEDSNTKTDLQNDCREKAKAFEAETKSRDESVRVLVKGKEIIQKAIKEASLSQMSFIQVSSETSHQIDPKTLRVVRLVRSLAHSHNSSSLVQLAGRLSSVVRSEADPFKRIKVLIADMIAKLTEGSDQDKYCKTEMSESNDKESDKSDAVQEISTKIDQARAKVATLKEEVTTLQKELSQNARSQSNMDGFRQKEMATYDDEIVELPKALAGIQTALKLLKDYFAKNSGDSDSTKIIAFLEDVEAQTSARLSELQTDEDGAKRSYKRMTADSQAGKEAKNQEVERLTKEIKELETALADLANDKEGAQEELDAVLEYFYKLKRKCSTDVKAFEEKQQQRKEEIEGLNKALEILADETSLIQRQATHRRLRGGANVITISG